MADPSASPLRKHLVRLAVLGLVPLAVLAALAIAITTQAHRAEVTRSTLNLSRAVAGTVYAELDATVATLANLSRATELQEGDIPGFYERARKLTEVHAEWTAITLADPQGRVLFRTSLPLAGGPFGPVDSESLLSVLESKRPTVGHASRGVRGQVAVPVRFPVLQGGRLAYVLTAVVKPDRLLAMLERQRVPEGWVVGVLDSSLRIFARSRAHQDHVLRQATPGLARLVGAGRQEGGGLLTDQEGTVVVTGFSRTPQYGWVVAVGAPAAPLVSLFTPTMALYVGGAVGSLLICAWLALRVARRMAADIRDVTDAAADLGAGRPLNVGASHIEEIQRLGRALIDASTRLRTAQDAQRDALQQAQEAVRAKDAFLAMLSHELRNPLAPMVSAMYLLDQRSDASSARERAVLRRQMEHLRRLVDDLLDVARINRGSVDLQLEPTELVQELRAVVEDLQQAQPAARSGIRLHAEVEQAWLQADAKRLAQVFTNLLANALRHGQGRPITLAVTATDDRVRVQVRDLGDGMAPHTLERVFEPFYQSEDTSAQPGGLGLGLAIVQSIVEGHGGTVTAHSEGLGHGSRFDVDLPLDPRRAAASAPAPA